jgi:hypothetical protein
MPDSVREWLIDWERSRSVGKLTSPTQIKELGEKIERQPLSLSQLASLIHTIGFVDGGGGVAALAKLAIDMAEQELAGFSSSAPPPGSLLEALWSLHDVLWGSEQWELDSRLLQVLLPWEVPGSGHSQWGLAVYAETLYLQRQYEAAYAAYQRVLDERKIAFEPSEGSNRGLDWEIGLCLYYAHRYSEAAPHFQAMTSNNGVPEGPLSWSLAIAAYARAGQVEEAERALDLWISERRPAVADVAPLLRLLDLARSGDKLPATIDIRPSSNARAEKSWRLAEEVTELLAESPRDAATKIFKERPLDVLESLGAHDVVAKLSLDCLNATPDRMDRIEYFLSLRARALLAGKRFAEAAEAAKSYYNAASVKNTSRAIALLSQCLDAAFPDDVGIGNRFKLQQLAKMRDEATPNSTLHAIKVDGSIYDGKGLDKERNANWRKFGEANLFLMRDQPNEAVAIFEELTRTAGEANLVDAAKAGIARAMKARAGNVVPANEFLKGLALTGADPK